MLDWKNVQVPLGVVVVIFMGWGYVSANYVHAEDYAQAQQQTALQVRELRIGQMTIERNALSSELFNLEYRLRGIAEPHPEDLKRIAQLKQNIADLNASIEVLRNEN